MLLSNKLRNRKDFRELGFGSANIGEDSRYLNRDGTFNVRKKGLSYFKRVSIYHDLITMKASRFIILVLLFYIIMNLIFASIYYVVGINHLGGIGPENAMGDFWEAFFFSCQTFTTVGYGRVNPVGMTANAIAAVESFAGLMAFALATGLLYGRFSRAKADLVFSNNALIAPYKGGINALMFRLAHAKKHVLNDVDVQVMAAMTIDDNGHKIRRFFPLNLELSKINFLSLTWTIVHPIDDDSPIRGMNAADLAESNLELMILLKGFDDTFSQDVHKRASYKHHEVVWGAKFVNILGNVEKGMVIIDLSKINDYQKAELNEVIYA